MDCIVVTRRRDEARVAAELEVVNLCFIGTTAEHEWACRVLRVDLPDSDERSFFTCSGQKIAASVHGHGSDGSLMTHDNGLDASICESSHFHMALLCMRDRKHTWALTVQRNQSILIVTGIEAVHEDQVLKSINIRLDL